MGLGEVGARAGCGEGGKGGAQTRGHCRNPARARRAHVGRRRSTRATPTVPAATPRHSDLTCGGRAGRKVRARTSPGGVRAPGWPLPSPTRRRGPLPEDRLRPRRRARAARASPRAAAPAWAPPRRRRPSCRPPPGTPLPPPRPRAPRRSAASPRGPSSSRRGARAPAPLRPRRRRAPRGRRPWGLASSHTCGPRPAAAAAPRAARRGRGPAPGPHPARAPAGSPTCLRRPPLSSRRGAAPRRGAPRGRAVSEPAAKRRALAGGQRGRGRGARAPRPGAPGACLDARAPCGAGLRLDGAALAPVGGLLLRGGPRGGGDRTHWRDEWGAQRSGARCGG
jgi:hypothetical protein